MPLHQCLFRPITGILLAAALVMLGQPSLAGAAEQSEEGTRHFATRSGMHFYAGEDVTVTAPADILFAAGASIDVESKDIAEIVAAGGDVDLADVATNRIIAAGGDVTIGGTITKSLIAAGGNVAVREGTKIGGDAILAGGNVEFAGDMDGELAASGGSITVGGRIGGDATLRAREITLRPGTTIGGNLSYSSRGELKIPEGVQIAGTVTRMGEAESWNVDVSFGKIIAGFLMALIGAIIALFIFSGVVLALFSRQIEKAAHVVSDQPLQSLGLGVLLTVALPVSVLILVITIIGIPLGLFTLATGGILAGLGIVVAAYWTGMTMRRAVAHDEAKPHFAVLLGWTLLGLVTFCLVGLMPFVGNLAQIVALMTGFGALVLSFMSTNRTGGQESAA